MRPQLSRRLRRAFEDTQTIASYIADLSFGDFQSDTKTSDAVERRLETMCDSVTALVRELPALETQIPEVRLISGLRNQLAHGYLDLQMDVIWSTITEDVPGLAAVLEQLVPLSDQELIERYGG